MRKHAVLSLFLACAGAASAEPDGLKHTKEAKIVPGSFVVEFEDATDRADFYNYVEDSLGQTHMNLDYKLFQGASVHFKETKSAQIHAAKLSSLPSVKNIWPKRLYSLPDDQVIWTGSSSSAESGATRTLRRQEANDTFSPHVMTQVDKLQNKGILGEGIKIGIIDTGVDYEHPALGGCFGSGCLVSYGTDIVGDDYTGYNTPVPDPDPIDKCAGHGTHVAGIIAAQANEYGFTGAAPGVTLGMFRVFGCDGSAANDVLIDAYMQAYEAGSQIITASIGGSSGWSEDPWAVAVSRIVEAGVPCTVSAGNDGSYGMFYASTAANGKKVTAIASFDNTVTPTLLIDSSFTVNEGDSETFGYVIGEPADWAGVNLPLWAPTYNVSDPATACEALPDDTPDLSGNIVLIRRGTCTFVEKATFAAEFGAQYVMFYNNVPEGATGPDVSEVSGILATGMVTAEQGESWIASLEAGDTVTLDMVDPDTAPISLIQDDNTLTGGFASTYTSWGPTFEMDIKPQLASPGGNILSTWPIPLGSYAVLSGTSMACPLVAAIYALIAEVRGTFDPATIENLLSATSNPQLFNDGTTTSPFLAPIMQQGSGLVQGYDAAYSTTLLSKSSLAFNDTDHFSPTANFTITNLAAEDVTYTLSNVPAGTGYTFSTSIYPDYFPGLEMVSSSSSSATLSFSPKDTITIPGNGGEVSVSVTLTPPSEEDLDPTRLPVYSGYITLNSTTTTSSEISSLSLPYQGAVGSLASVPVLDTAWVSASTDADLNPVAANTTFRIPSDTTTTTNATLPVIVGVLAFGTPKVDVRLLKDGGGGEEDLGSIESFPVEYLSRDYFAVEWDGTMEDGGKAEEGSGYTLKVLASRVFGEEGDEDVAETVKFGIKYI